MNRNYTSNFTKKKCPDPDEATATVPGTREQDFRLLSAMTAQVRAEQLILSTRLRVLGQGEPERKTSSSQGFQTIHRRGLFL